MKRVLIITYYWPPAGGPGVQRWLKFVTYFREFGIEPVVYVPENPHYPIVDESFVAQIPKGIEIIKHPIKEPYRFSKFLSKKKTKQISSGIITQKKPSFMEQLLLYIRGNFFIPDARIGWVKPSVKYLKQYLLQHPVDAIITSGPPHSLHLIGLELKEALDVKWIADFRDPWTTIHYHKSLRLSKVSEKKHKKLEAEVLAKADCIVVTSPTTKTEFEAITKTPIEVVTNGYDLLGEMNRDLDTAFSIAHIGSLLSERNPKVLWEVLSEITSENDVFKEDLQLKLVGIVSKEIVESITSAGLIKQCEFVGYVSHREAIQLQRNAQVLLLIEMDRPETRAIIPGKLFEYLAAQRPIIGLGPEGSDFSKIITETNSGYFFTYNEKEALRKKILEFYEAFKNGALEVSSNRIIITYSRRELTRKMATLINRL